MHFKNNGQKEKKLYPTDHVGYMPVKFKICNKIYKGTPSYVHALTRHIKHCLHFSDITGNLYFDSTIKSYKLKIYKHISSIWYKVG